MLKQLANIVGQHNVVLPEDAAAYFEEKRGKFTSQALAVVRPKSTIEVSEVVKVCAKQGISIVPQGGNTGLCGGGVSTAEQIILSLGRMNQIRSIDVDNFTITVDAGCILEEIQTAADQQNRFFPLSLGAEGTCQIGGNLSTNAGGINVLRYGNARDLALGLEVVLADGRIWNGLNALRKNNTGYDLKNLFIGAEGTLGIITGACLKLFPKPIEAVTALVALPGLDAVISLFSSLRAASSDRISTFELIPRIAIELTAQHFSEHPDLFEEPHPWYVLVILHSTQPDPYLRSALETALEKGFEAKRINDAIFAASEAQASKLVHLREKLVAAQKLAGGSIKHDIAVPISRIPEFIRRANKSVETTIPGARPYPFGHIGDGNIHYNISQPIDMATDDYLALWGKLNTVIHDLVAELGGSFSAEHGIGMLKTEEMAKYQSDESLFLMRSIKQALDPRGVLNPGKVLP